MSSKNKVVNKRDLRKYLKLWEKGKITKTEIERQLGVSTARGKWITRQWDARLGENTVGSRPRVSA